MDELIKERVERAKWLLENVKHAAMATVNGDGTPHNTPYFFMASEDLTELYWGSHPESLHSQNILRTGDLFVALYEANEGGGLYIRAKNGRMAENDELTRALARHNELRARHGRDPLPPEYYQNSSTQKMWIADTTQFWVNAAERDDKGRLTRDTRHEVARSDLRR